MQPKPQVKGRRARLISPPVGVSKIVEQVLADDRHWFEEHPGAAYRQRPAIPGEFWPVFDSRSVRYVMVVEVRPGFRLRLPVVGAQWPQTEQLQ